LSIEIDLHIALEHGLMSIAGILHVSSSPCSDANFRRLLARIRRDADIAAHYARRYLENGGPVPRRSFFEEVEAILDEERSIATSAAGAERRQILSWAARFRVAPAPMWYEPPPPKALATSGSTQDLAGALRLVIQGVHMFCRVRGRTAYYFLPEHRLER
jgi:hypothetical protein